MEWYAWIFLALAVIAAIAFVIVLIFKSRPIVRGLSEEERKALIDLEREKVNKELKIEREKTQRLEDIAKGLRERVAKLNTWYEGAKEKLDAERKSEFEAYIDDPDSLSAELDKLLGIDGSADDPTNPS